MSKKNIEAIYALSPQQKGMLFDTLSASESGIHVEQKIYALRGDLDVPALERAWQRVVDRHTILRTAFVWKDQVDPLQVVLRSVELSPEKHDWCELSFVEQQKRLEAYLDQDRRRGFDLSKAPLMRLALIRMGESRYQLVWTHHHIIIDGWCRPLIDKEVYSFYAAFSRGRDLQLEPSRPYRDYIAWLKQQDLSKAEVFWRNTLSGIRKPTALGAEEDSGNFFEQEERYGNEKARLSGAATAALKSLARRHRLTTNTLIQGAWALLLSRYSGEKDVVFGTTVSGRPLDLAGAESMIGLFINTLPFRVTIRRETPLWSWFKEVQAQHLELRHYEYCSAGQVHQWCEVPGSLPLYESILVFENYPTNLSIPRLPNLTSDTHDARSIGAQTRHALTVLVGEDAELDFHVVYDCRRLDGVSVGWMLEHFRALLTAMIADPEPADLATLVGSIPADQIPKFRVLQTLDQRRSGNAFAEPRTATEEKLAHIWAEVLGVKRVSIHDNFFELRGHSLLAAQVISRVREAFRVELPLRCFFESPTVAGLAASVATAENSGAELQSPTIVPVSREAYRAKVLPQGKLAVPEALKDVSRKGSV